MRGFEFTHEAMRDWEERFAAIFRDELRTKGRGKIGEVWFVDETYIQVKGKWCYLYRGIDAE
ncbi:DDE-type integrase/transposase/recombinase [Myxosarcina sp. GI1(2024)]